MKKLGLILILAFVLISGCKKGSSSGGSKTLVCVLEMEEGVITYKFEGEKPIITVVMAIDAHHSAMGYTSIEMYEADKRAYEAYLGQAFAGYKELESHANGDNIVATVTYDAKDFDFSGLVDETDYNKITFDELSASATADGLSCVVE
ncbi:MAG: hypothetical protein LBR25_07865 [Erysipelotrichaceae bacterium]|jgi:hypothetical protein|nr:hypothetical protein [Erysipelotrichaceae bacterium]